MKILLATGNKNKVREFRGLFSESAVEVLSLEDFPGLKLPPEQGETFSQNALEKACYGASVTGFATLADDSGLVVDALGGAPGVFSARYAGEDSTDRDNIAKLLEEMRGVAPEDRGARFVCVLAYVEPGEGGLERTFTGTLEGSIATELSGDGGFGYDPVFFIPCKGVTAAMLSMEDKNAISHRGDALRRLKEWFKLRDKD